MAGDPDAGKEADISAYIGSIGLDEVVDADQLRPTPQQHELLKDQLHGSEQFDEIKRAERRYLVVGRGGENGAGTRRLQVCRQLDARSEASAFMLEDFGFTADKLALWAPAFDVLSAMATHVVGILEDFDGGHVWELGFLYHQQLHIRDILWLLKRLYESDDRMHEKYDNGMAASHMAVLEEAAGDRLIEWRDEDDLSDAVSEIP